MLVQYIHFPRTNTPQYATSMKLLFLNGGLPFRRGFFYLLHSVFVSHPINHAPNLIRVKKDSGLGHARNQQAVHVPMVCSEPLVILGYFGFWMFFNYAKYKDGFLGLYWKIREVFLTVLSYKNIKGMSMFSLPFHKYLVHYGCLNIFQLNVILNNIIKAIIIIIKSVKTLYP